jgi:hypothetical protein
VPGPDLIADRGGILQVAELASRYLIILISDRAKSAINLQATSGPAWLTLAALISLPRASASSRKLANSFMQASDGASALAGGNGTGLLAGASG